MGKHWDNIVPARHERAGRHGPGGKPTAFYQLGPDIIRLVPLLIADIRDLDFVFVNVGALLISRGVSSSGTSAHPCRLPALHSVCSSLYRVPV